MDFHFIGQQLKRYRSKHELSFDEFSKKSGVSRSMLCQLEMGKTTPTLTVAAKLAEAMEMKLGQLVDPGDNSEVCTVIPSNAKAQFFHKKSGYSEWFLNEESSRRDTELYRWTTTKSTTKDFSLCRTRTRTYLWLTKGSATIQICDSQVKLKRGEFAEIKTPNYGFSLDLSAQSAGIWVHSYA